MPVERIDGITHVQPSGKATSSQRSSHNTFQVLRMIETSSID